MKRYLLFLACLCVMQLSARELTTFWGIDMNQPVKQFCNELKKMGYKTVKKNDRIINLDGNFRGLPSLITVGIKDDGTVERVIWSVEPKQGWSNMLLAYYMVKDQVTNEFCQPDSCYETYNPIKSEIQQMMDLRDMRSECRINYVFDNGGVSAWLGYLPTPVVMIFYTREEE